MFRRRRRRRKGLTVGRALGLMAAWQTWKAKASVLGISFAAIAATLSGMMTQCSVPSCVRDIVPDNISDSILSALGNSAKTTQGKELLRVDAPQTNGHASDTFKGFEVCFNQETHQPDFVAWELLGSEATGSAKREDEFHQGKFLGCVESSEYSGSGYDRGHMAPAADMKWNEKAMWESFGTYNICPQSPDLNRGTWQKLEDKCRQWAVRDSALVIVCGPIYSDNPKTIGKTVSIPVPSAFFKVILAPYAKPTRAIGFVMENGKVPGGMARRVVTVDEVERITGYDFFPALPDDIEDEVEAKASFSDWE